MGMGRFWVFGKGFLVLAKAAGRGFLGLLGDFGPKIAKNWRFWDFGGICTGVGRTFGQNSVDFARPSSSDRFK